jgi:hypothetical protein
VCVYTRRGLPDCNTVKKNRKAIKRKIGARYGPLAIKVFVRVFFIYFDVIDPEGEFQHTETRNLIVKGYATELTASRSDIGHGYGQVGSQEL